MDNTIFAKRLKEARTAAGLTQGELSKTAGVTAATISAYESADGTKGKNPSLDNALKLAQALHISLDWLCGSVVTNEQFRITDFLKMFVKLSQHCRISIDNVDFADESNENLLSNAAKIYISDEEDYFQYQQEKNECEHFRKKITYYLPFIYIKNDYITHFLKEWQKIDSLYKSGTIDTNLYNLWLNQQFEKIDNEQKQREEFYKELVEEANNLKSSKDGEPDGND